MFAMGRPQHFDSGPIAEAIVATRLLANLNSDNTHELLEQAIAGESVITIAFHDIALIMTASVGRSHISSVVP